MSALVDLPTLPFLEYNDLKTMVHELVTSQGDHSNAYLWSNKDTSID